MFFLLWNVDETEWLFVYPAQVCFSLTHLGAPSLSSCASQVLLNNQSELLDGLLKHFQERNFGVANDKTRKGATDVLVRTEFGESQPLPTSRSWFGKFERSMQNIESFSL